MVDCWYLCVGLYVHRPLCWCTLSSLWYIEDGESIHTMTHTNTALYYCTLYDRHLRARKTRLFGLNAREQVVFLVSVARDQLRVELDLRDSFASIY